MNAILNYTFLAAFIITIYFIIITKKELFLNKLNTQYYFFIWLMHYMLFMKLFLAITYRLLTYVLGGCAVPTVFILILMILQQYLQ